MRQSSPLLGKCFVRLLDWVEPEDGRVVVLRPRLGGNRVGRRWAAWFGLGDYRIRLDEMGTLVWKHCDGETKGRTIAELLRRRFAAEVEPAEERLLQFINQMIRARMIAVQGGSEKSEGVEGHYGSLFSG